MSLTVIPNLHHHLAFLFLSGFCILFFVCFSLLFYVCSDITLWFQWYMFRVSVAMHVLSYTMKTCLIISLWGIEFDVVEKVRTFGIRQIMI